MPCEAASYVAAFNCLAIGSARLCDVLSNGVHGISTVSPFGYLLAGEVPMNAILLAFALLFSSGSGGYSEPHEYTVDLIELNHRFDATTGLHQYDQLIFWRLSPSHRRYGAMGWVLMDDTKRLDHYPSKIGKWWKCTPGKPDRRTFRSEMFRETFTGYDPQVANEKLNESLPLKSIVE